MLNGLRNCRLNVEQGSDYLEGALTWPSKLRFLLHATFCRDCHHHLGQLRQTVKTLQSTSPESLSPDSKKKLLQTLRQRPKP